MSDKSSNANQRDKPKAPLSEWIIAAVGLIVVTGAVAAMLYEAVAGDHSPPSIRLSVMSIEDTRNGWRVEIAAYNEGGQTASEVLVEGSLPDTEGETAEATFDFLPPKSERRGGLFFKTEPTEQSLTLRTLGYREP